MLHTPLHARHVALGGRMVDFAGWSMPVQYGSIVDEHRAVRAAAGLFDVSHMGHLRLSGRDALPLAERLISCRVETMKPGQVRYGLVTNEMGGVRDDVLISRIGEQEFAFVVNASNREKITQWFTRQAQDRDVELGEPAEIGTLLALQGPQAAAILAPHVDFDLGSLRYYRFAPSRCFSQPVTISRTGYTGEDGFEIAAPAECAGLLWDRLLEAGQSAGLVPCGLGCRDTLRLEAGMPLYGHELSEEIDPLTAGLGFAVALDKEFLGRGAIAQVAEAGPTRIRVGLRLEGKRIAREGTPLMLSGEQVGVVTSGTYSPTREASLAMGYVAVKSSAVGTPIEAEIRGRREQGVIVPLPFYRRS